MYDFVPATSRQRHFQIVSVWPPLTGYRTCIRNRELRKIRYECVHQTSDVASDAPSHRVKSAYAAVLHIFDT